MSDLEPIEVVARKVYADMKRVVNDACSWLKAGAIPTTASVGGVASIPAGVRR